MSHPNPRSTVPFTGCWGAVIFAIVAGVSTPRPPSSKACAKTRQVVGGRKYSRMARHAAHPARRRVMHHAAQQVMVLVLFGRSDASVPRLRRSKPGLFHAERLKDMLRGIRIERLAREPLHQRAQYDEADVAI